MSTKIIAQRIWTKKLPVGHDLVDGNNTMFSLRAVAQLHSIGGQAPYFSLTGELVNKRRSPAHQVEMAGQMGPEPIAEWPELAPLQRIHMSDENGVPMHAVGNGLYWLGLTKFKTAQVRNDEGRLVDTDLPYFPYFQDLWRVSEDEAKAAYEYITSQDDPEAALEVLALACAPRWAEEAKQALALIRASR
jgi:hypothetical protein